MYMKLSSGGKRRGRTTMAMALLLGTAFATFASDSTPDQNLAPWLGREFTIESSTINDHMPIGGKLTFIYDSADDTVRICTRTVPSQRGPWRMDFANPCGVALVFTRGTRYCSLEDVKTGNGEVLSACHRLRSHDVVMRPSAVRGTLELNDMIVFLVPAESGKHVISILVDSPSRVTGDGVIVGRD
jgi:hypothetical protein